MPTVSSIFTARSHASLLRARVMHAHDFGDLIADLEHGIERRHRFLKDHRHARAADLRASTFRRASTRFVSVEVDLAARFDASGRANEAEERERGDRLAAARFADEADRFAGADLEADAVDRPRDTVLGVEVRAKVVEREGAAQPFSR